MSINLLTFRWSRVKFTLNQYYMQKDQSQLRLLADKALLYKRLDESSQACKKAIKDLSGGTCVFEEVKIMMLEELQNQASRIKTAYGRNAGDDLEYELDALEILQDETNAFISAFRQKFNTIVCPTGETEIREWLDLGLRTFHKKTSL